MSWPNSRGPDGDKVRRFYEAYFGQLEGATITKVELGQDDTDDEGDLWPKLHVTLKDGATTVVEVSGDEEGNHPGFLFGLDDRYAREVANSGS